MNSETGPDVSVPADAKSQLIPADWQVPGDFRNRLGDEIGKQRSMICDDQLLVVLHEPPHPDEMDRKGRVFWRDSAGRWVAHGTSHQTRGLDEHLLQYQQRLDVLDSREATASTALEYFELMSELTAIQRAARHQYAALQEAREKIDTRDLINFRDMAYNIERQADLLLSDSKNAMELTTARQAEEQAEISYYMSVSAHRLNVLVAFFFPIATLTAVFGVNMDTGLEHYAPPLPFLVTISAGLLAGLMLKLSVTRKPSRSGSVKRY